MKKYPIAIPSRPLNSLVTLDVQSCTTTKKSKLCRLFGDHDFVAGKKDASKFPSTWSKAVHKIESEELRNRDMIQNIIYVSSRIARGAVDQFSPLYEEINSQINVMAAQGELLPEVYAKSLKISARSIRLLANLLLVAEVCSLFAVQVLCPSNNTLLMTGIALGMVLLICALHNEASVKLAKANKSMDLYDNLKELQNCEAAWKRALINLKEYEKKVDQITESIIRDRKRSYRQGFHRGAAGKPEAAQFLKELVQQGR